MKNKTLIITFIIFLSLLAISLLVLMIILLNGGFKNFNPIMFSSVSERLLVEEEYKESFRMIEIDSDASEIEFISTDDDTVKVVIYGDEKNINFSKKADRISIASKMKCHFFCFNQERSKIEIYLPKSYDGKIKVNNDYGNVTIGEFKSANVIVENNCGNIDVVAGDTVKLDNDFGDITLEYANSADIEQNAGKITVGEVSDIKAENDFGDIYIEKITNSLTLKNNCGDIIVDEVILSKSSSIKNDLGKIKIGFTNKIYIDASTDLGKVKINENTRQSDVTLKLENNCGDIIVDN